MITKDFINTFQSILFDAAALFGRPASEINIDQFRVVAKGRLSVSPVRIVGYVKLRNYVAPSATVNKAEQKALKALITKLVHAK